MAGQTHGVSGKNGKVMVGSCSVGEVTDWTATYDQGTFTYQSANGGGWQKVIRTNKKVSGTIKGFYDTEYPIEAVTVGDSLVALKLYFSVSGGKYLYVPGAMLGPITYTVNMNTGAAEEWSCTFESDGSASIV